MEHWSSHSDGRVVRETTFYTKDGDADVVREVIRFPRSRTDQPIVEGRGKGGGPLNPEEWPFLRGTGLAGAIYSNWLSRSQRKFGDFLINPAGPGTGGRPVRETPRLGLDSVINPSEGNQVGRPGGRNKPLDLKDPAEPSGTVAVPPIPKPKPKP